MTMNATRFAALIPITLLAALFISGCGPSYVTDAEEPKLDSYTMSLRFDRKDMQRLYKENIAKMLTSRIAKQWERQAAHGTPASVAIFPMRNETSEHIDTQLDTILSSFETDLVNQSAADVVSMENQHELIAEIKRQQSSAYDPQRLARYGRQIGAQYFVTGKVFDVSERDRGERRVQYTMFVQVLNVETSKVEFQSNSTLTKALVR